MFEDMDMHVLQNDISDLAIDEACVHSLHGSTAEHDSEAFHAMNNHVPDLSMIRPD